MSIQDKFFQLLRLALGASSDIPAIQMQDWEIIYEMAKKQSLLGIVFDGIEKMEDAAKMEPGLLMKWLGQCKQIEKRNYQLNEAVIHVTDYFKKKGFDSCILKGQGNALMYPNPLHRTPGDIDIWVSGKPSDVISFVHSVAPNEKASYHHIDFPTYNEIPVEVHYRPCYLQDFIHNKRLQRFFRSTASKQFSNRVDGESGSFAVPTARFNVMYQLAHMFGHLFQDGIGLRQIFDYYFNLVHWHTDSTDLAALQQDLRRLGLYEFAGAMMYVHHEVLELSEEMMVAPMDEKRGKLLLDEIIRGGNFGKYDDRCSFGYGAIGHNLKRLFRDMRLLRYYPIEALSEPFFRIWHFFWRSMILWQKGNILFHIFGNIRVTGNGIKY